MGKDDEFFRSTVNLEKVMAVETTEGLSLGDRIMIILHNQAMMWDKLKAIEEKKCCKD